MTHFQRDHTKHLFQSHKHILETWHINITGSWQHTRPAGFYLTSWVGTHRDLIKSFVAIECKGSRRCCSSLWVQVWGWVRPRVYFPCEQRRWILRSAEHPAIPPQSLFRSEPDNTDLFWPRELSLLSMQRRALCKGLCLGPWGRSWNTKNFICTGVTSSHTSMSSLYPIALDFVTHWVFKKNLFLLHISKQIDKIAFRLSSVLYRGRRERSQSSSSRYQLQISRKELLSN